VRDERLNRLLTGADQHGQLASLPKVVGRHRRLTVQQHALRRPTGEELDALVSDMSEDIGKRAVILAGFWQQRRKCLPNL
jgi:hypothetical protein